MDKETIASEIIEALASLIFVVGTLTIAIHLAKNGEISWPIAVALAYLIGVIDERVFW